MEISSINNFKTLDSMGHEYSKGFNKFGRLLSSFPIPTLFLLRRSQITTTIQETSFYQGSCGRTKNKILKYSNQYYYFRYIFHSVSSRLSKLFSSLLCLDYRLKFSDEFNNDDFPTPSLEYITTF